LTGRDENWSDYSLDPEVRSDRNRAWYTGGRDVNSDGRLTYGSYLNLPRLLSAQTPGTRIPDERVFIITHQICELAFKQMRFDLDVIGRTVKEAQGSALKAQGLRLKAEADEAFWKPALTAAGRLHHTASRVLPSAIGYLAYQRDPTFDSGEFGFFREKLIPASGFQSVQFRAIQAALGKRHLLDLNIYPAAFYRKHYNDNAVINDGIAISPSNEMIVREGIPFGEPVDDLVQTLLASLGQERESKVRFLAREDFAVVQESLWQGVKALRKSAVLREAMGDESRLGGLIHAFEVSLPRVIEAENLRRAKFAGAAAGFQRLLSDFARHPVERIVRLLASTDRALHGPEPRSFLSQHQRFVARRIREVNYYASVNKRPRQTPGTGGGGVPYLDLMHRRLLPLFPALVSLGRP